MEHATSKFAANIPKTLHRDVRVFCVTNGVKFQSAVAEALEDWLKRKQMDQQNARQSAVEA